MRERARVQELQNGFRRRSARQGSGHAQRHTPRRALQEGAPVEARLEVIGARGEDEPVRPQARRAPAAADGHGNVRAEGVGCLVLIVVVVAGVVAAGRFFLALPFLVDFLDLLLLLLLLLLLCQDHRVVSTTHHLLGDLAV